jgi:hypothetical protein
MSDELAKKWLKTKFSNMPYGDVNWTMKRYNWHAVSNCNKYLYPDYVYEYIKNNWVKKNDNNGGTYHEPGYEKKCLKDDCRKKQKEEKNKPQTVQEIIRNKIKKDPSGKAHAKFYQQTVFAEAMDDNNKEALKVAAEEGINAAAKYMMSSAGGDYARMRSMYG